MEVVVEAVEVDEAEDVVAATVAGSPPIDAVPDIIIPTAAVAIDAMTIIDRRILLEDGDMAMAMDDMAMVADVVVDVVVEGPLRDNRPIGSRPKR
jgi:hypothetical protein